MGFNGLLNQGEETIGDQTRYGVVEGATTAVEILDRLHANCKKGLSDEIMQFVCFAVAIGLIALGYVRLRKGGKTGSYV